MGYVDCEEWVDPWQEHLDFEAGAEDMEKAFLRREAYEEALREAAIESQEIAEAEEAADFFVQEATVKRLSNQPLKLRPTTTPSTSSFEPQHAYPSIQQEERPY